MDSNLKSQQCQQKGHERYFIVCVVLRNDDQAHRLACPKCICEFHSDQTNNVIFLEDIFKGNHNAENWFNDGICNKVSTLNQSIERQEQEERKNSFLDSIHSFEACYNTALEHQQMIIKEGFQSFKQKFIQVISTLKEKFHTLYGLESLHRMLRSYSEKQISNEQLNKELSAYINRDDRSATLKEMEVIFKKKLRLCPMISKAVIDEGKTGIQGLVEFLPQVLKMGQWYYQSHKYLNYNANLVIEEQGRVLKTSNLDPQTYVYGSAVFKDSMEYEWTIQIEDIPTNTYNSIYMGLIVESKKEEVNNLFNQMWSVYLDVVNNAVTPNFILQTGKQSMSEVVKKQMNAQESIILKFKFDNEKKTFEVKDQAGEAHYIFSFEKIKSIRVNNNFMGYQNQQQFFSIKNKYRPFIMGYSCSCKITLLDS